MKREMNTYKVTFTADVSVCPDYWGGNEKQAILEVLSESFMDYVNNLQYEKVATEMFDEDEEDDENDDFI